MARTPANREAGRATVVFAYSLGKAQRLLAGLDAGAGPIFTHGAVEKVNAAYEAAASPGSIGDSNVLPDYKGRDGGGHIAEHVIGNVVGIKFDNYVGVDFKAFRDMVDALGGIQVCMDTKLDDYEYPNYHNGYIRGGVHFPAGCYQVNGEQALELARSRHAVQPDQASDFGRARRQQMIMLAIKQKAISVNGLAKAPQLRTSAYLASSRRRRR